MSSYSDGFADGAGGEPAAAPSGGVAPAEETSSSQPQWGSPAGTTWGPPLGADAGTAAQPPPPPAPDGTWAGPPGWTAPPPLPPTGLGRVRKMRMVWKIVIGFVLLIAIAAGVSSRVSVPYYAITPGNSIDVSRFIQLPADKVRHHAGSVYMTDVLLTPLNALDYPYFKYLNSQATVLPNSQVIGFLPVSEYNTEGSIDMSDATQAAQYVALHELGYKVGAILEGFQLYVVDPAAPSYSAISVGEVMTAVNGHPLKTADDITNQIIHAKPGDTISVTVRPYTQPLTGKETTVKVTLGEYRTQAGNDRCYTVGTGTKYPLLKVKGGPSPYPCLGIEIYAFYKLTNLPFKISIDPGDIVGPSAGLAFTLGVMNELDPVSLTGGRHIAATGSMALDGTVGEVGGLPQKTIAVQNAGATVFFVPAGQNYKAAKTKAGPGLTLVPVKTLQDALKWLLAHGGKIITPSGKVIR